MRCSFDAPTFAFANHLKIVGVAFIAVLHGTPLANSVHVSPLSFFFVIFVMYVACGPCKDRSLASPSEMKSVKLDELEGIHVFETLVWKPVRKTLGVTAFGINAYVAANAGDLVVEDHDESTLGHEEIYAVIRGHATFTVDGEEVDAPEGTLVYLDKPAEQRSAVAREPGTTVLAIGGVPGRHEISAWEYFFPALPLVEQGRWDEVKPMIEEGLAAKPDHPALLLWLARCEAHLGEADAAREHAARALAERPGLREYVTDEALLPLLPALP